MGVTHPQAPERSVETPSARRTGWGGVWDRLPSASSVLMARLAITTLVANIVLVVTGGLVRLTDSGLGCPTWPQCTSASLVAYDALGIHGFIEFGNRMLTFVLTAICLATWLAALRLKPFRAPVARVATAILIGIPIQAVIGGISVRTHLNPWVVSLHMLCSLGIIQLAVLLIRRVREGDGPPVRSAPVGTVLLAWGAFAMTWLVLYAGTVVTGAGPHAGNAEAPRNGLSPESMAQLHADLVCLLVGLTIGLLAALRVGTATPRLRWAVWWLTGLEVAQAALGFTQYFLGVPVVLVAFHVLGAALVAAGAAAVVLATRERAGTGEPMVPLSATSARLPEPSVAVEG